MKKFEVVVNEETYFVTLDSMNPRTYLIQNPNTRHVIEQHINGHWVAIRHRPLSHPIPVQEIGEEITRMELL